MSNKPSLNLLDPSISLFIERCLLSYFRSRKGPYTKESIEYGQRFSGSFPL